MPDPTAESGKNKIAYNGVEYTVTREGLAEILEQPMTRTSKPGQILPSPSDVFYNPIQQFNRDLSVVAIRAFAEVFAVDKLAKARCPASASQAPRKEESQPKGAEEFNTLNEAQRHGNGDGDDVMVALKRKRVKPEDDAPEHTKRAKTGVADKSDPDHDSEAEPTPGAANAYSGTAAPRKPPFRILDALSATGLRALRYSKEIEQVTLVVANDLSNAAVEKIKLHMRHNNLLGKVHAIVGDAKSHMYRIGSESSPLLPDGQRGKYHVIDLDPYGTAAHFLDAAVQALQDGGLLCVTCTDAGVFASTGYLEKTHALYGGLPIKGLYSHEGGLRLILHAVAMSAARYGLAIEPLLSLSIDFYARAFVRVRKSPHEVKFLPGKTIEVYTCDSGCGAWVVQPIARTQAFQNRNDETLYKFTASQAPISERNCPHCGFRQHLAGPMWGGYLHNPFFINRMLDMLPTLDEKIYGTIPRMHGMLATARDEMLLPEGLVPMAKMNPNSKTTKVTEASSLNIPLSRLPPDLRDEHPFYVLPPQLSKVLRCVAPSAGAIRSALLGLNYRVTRSHAKAGSIRTDAPWTVIWEVMREWVRQKSPLKKGPKVGTAGFGIMLKDRSKQSLTGICSELATIASQARDAEEIQNKLRALLWRLEHPTPPAKTLSSTSADATKEDAVSPEQAADRNDSNTMDTNRLSVVFDEALGKEPEGERLVRYQENPRPNWGPQMRAK